MNCTWHELVARISFRPHLKLSVRVENRSTLMVYDDLQAVVTLGNLVDHQTGQPTQVHKACALPPAERITERAAVMLIRRLAREVLEHELDECLLLDGVQVEDPHINLGELVTMRCEKHGDVTHKVEAVQRDATGRRVISRASCRPCAIEECLAEGEKRTTYVRPPEAP